MYVVVDADVRVGHGCITSSEASNTAKGVHLLASGIEDEGLHEAALPLRGSINVYFKEATRKTMVTSSLLSFSSGVKL